MYRIILVVLTVIFGVSSTLANSAKATYVLQVSSNLGCDSLEIQLLSQDKNTQQLLKYSKSAFDAVELPGGNYQFGEVTCVTNGKSESFDVLQGKIAPLRLSNNQAYFGGKLVFLKATDKEADIDTVSNCPEVISRARVDEHGDSNNGTECKDGAGVDTRRQTTKQIKVFAPKATDDELNVVRSAFKATKEQLLYLPIEV